jgi:menaquinone-dependent protoporphyrinogen IX oxidase
MFDLTKMADPQNKSAKQALFILTVTGAIMFISYNYYQRKLTKMLIDNEKEKDLEKATSKK